MKSPTEQKSRDYIEEALAGLIGCITSNTVVGKGHTMDALNMLEAMRVGRFYFEREPWHDVDRTDDIHQYPSEMLLRPQGPDYRPLNIFGAITCLIESGLHEPFDKAVILASIDQALREGTMPISINTSARNMPRPDFWDDVSDLLRTHYQGKIKHGDITFEVTEDDLASNPCRDVLLEMKHEFGCRFAVDDFYHDRKACQDNGDDCDSHDWERLENLAGIVDFVKIDGETIEAALKDDFDLAPLMKRIYRIVPEAHIVTERVKNAEQAQYLRQKFGIHAVQGRDLTQSTQDFTRELNAVASKSGAATMGVRPR